MIHIQNILGKRDLGQLSQNFYNDNATVLKARLKAQKAALNNPGYNTASGMGMGNYLDANLEFIITQPLEDVLNKVKTEIHAVFEVHYKTYNKVDTDFKKAINQVLFFEDYNQWKPYDFTKNIGLHCCPYCNRTYITTLGKDKKKFSRPDIDHFLPKSKYGYLRFSFFNLIPSCVICNRNAKGRKSTSLKNNIYPYLEGFGSVAKFTYIPKDYNDSIGKGNPQITFEYAGDKKLQSKAKKNISLFRLEEQYSIHTYELNHLLKLVELHGETYIENLLSDYPSLIKDEKEAYELAFGRPFDEIHDEKLPLSKFTRDILEGMDMLTKLISK